jgi:hypothetical protein
MQSEGDSPVLDSIRAQRYWEVIRFEILETHALVAFKYMAHEAVVEGRP